MCAHAYERLVRGKALYALDDLKQQRPAVFLPINYFIFTLIFFSLVGVSVFHRLAEALPESRIINRIRKEQTESCLLSLFYMSW